MSRVSIPPDCPLFSGLGGVLVRGAGDWVGVQLCFSTAPPLGLADLDPGEVVWLPSSPHCPGDASQGNHPRQGLLLLMTGN